jgi:geranylgeranyl diphosphate synthase, type I
MIDEISSVNLGSLIQQRGKSVLEKFNEVIASGISDPKLLTILQFIKDYWRDNYRPALISFCCEAVGGSVEAAEDAALMVTLTSAGGGIHDDIIDKSVNKHFRNTVYGLYGLNSALLVGDLMIIKGWAVADELAKKISPERMSKIIQVFGEWTANVCEAEFMELSCIRNLDTSLECYEGILRKSMADAQACAKLGAIMGNGSEVQVQALAEYGSDLGFLFRLSNDIGDIANSEGNLALRLENESVPLPILYAAKTSSDNFSRIQAILSKQQINPENISELLHLVHNSKAYSYVVDKTLKTKENASKKLLHIDKSGARSILSLLLDKTVREILYATNISCID